MKAINSMLKGQGALLSLLLMTLLSASLNMTVGWYAVTYFVLTKKCILVWGFAASLLNLAVIVSTTLLQDRMHLSTLLSGSTGANLAKQSAEFFKPVREEVSSALSKADGLDLKLQMAVAQKAASKIQAATDSVRSAVQRKSEDVVKEVRPEQKNSNEATSTQKGAQPDRGTSALQKSGASKKPKHLVKQAIHNVKQVVEEKSTPSENASTLKSGENKDSTTTKKG